ncbi:MAG: hypothetical protein JSS83_17410 [Cyanobacteria bacterium SZAS LIN-3]|nr:hypothetical protein [Cyanobacteria bacterium SZAS LIN-3]
MTITVTVKVSSGVVLAADSASSVFIDEAPLTPFKVYNGTFKLFNVIPGAPVGLVTSGINNLGDFTLAQQIDRFWAELSRPSDNRPRGQNDRARFNPKDFTMADLADRLKTFLFTGCFNSAYPSVQTRPVLSVVLSGYSTDKSTPEIYTIEAVRDRLVGPTLSQAPITTTGLDEPIRRLLYGVPVGLDGLLIEAGLPPAEVGQFLGALASRSYANIHQKNMPLASAIELAEYLVDTVIKYEHFSPMAPQVGGPVDIATITRNDGFQWVKRKKFHE